MATEASAGKLQGNPGTRLARDPSCIPPPPPPPPPGLVGWWGGSGGGEAHLLPFTASMSPGAAVSLLPSTLPRRQC